MSHRCPLKTGKVQIQHITYLDMSVRKRTLISSDHKRIDRSGQGEQDSESLKIDATRADAPKSSALINYLNLVYLSLWSQYRRPGVLSSLSGPGPIAAQAR